MNDRRIYEPCLPEVDDWTNEGKDDTFYLQTDHLGTTRRWSDADGATGEGDQFGRLDKMGYDLPPV